MNHIRYENPRCCAKNCRSTDIFFSTTETDPKGRAWFNTEIKTCRTCGEVQMIRGIIPVDARTRIVVSPTRWGNGVFSPQYWGTDRWYSIRNIWHAHPYRMFSAERAMEVIDAWKAGDNDHQRWWDWCSTHPSSTMDYGSG